MFRAIAKKLGKPTIGMVSLAGGIGTMLAQSIVLSFKKPYKFDYIFKQMEFIGVRSLSVVLITGTFTGMVLALQSSYGFSKFGADALVGVIVTLSMTRELGPVLTSLMVAGRAGSAMAAEIGTMRVTEQIDALTVMALNPVKYLVAPRVVASVLMLPILTIISDFVGVVGGYLVGVKLLGINE
ncbi:MAG TPA: ABC transporter permease, partial [Syntrophorhabdaceae bacterium]|nr:ABC transporter permease [Syntrophorhabdaceae bacterium]